MNVKVTTLAIPMLLVATMTAEAAPKPVSHLVLRDLQRGNKKAKIARTVKRERDRVRLMRAAGLEYRRAMRRAASALPRATGAERIALVKLVDDAKDKLVSALNVETAHYLKLRATSKAAARNAEALKWRPKDTQALTFQNLLETSKRETKDRAVNNSIASARWAARRSTTNPNNPQSRFNARRSNR